MKATLVVPCKKPHTKGNLGEKPDFMQIVRAHIAARKKELEALVSAGFDETPEAARVFEQYMSWRRMEVTEHLADSIRSFESAKTFMETRFHVEASDRERLLENIKAAMENGTVMEEELDRVWEQVDRADAEYDAYLEGSASWWIEFLNTSTEKTVRRDMCLAMMDLLRRGAPIPKSLGVAFSILLEYILLGVDPKRVLGLTRARGDKRRHPQEELLIAERMELLILLGASKNQAAGAVETAYGVESSQAKKIHKRRLKVEWPGFFDPRGTAQLIADGVLPVDELISASDWEVIKNLLVDLPEVGQKMDRLFASTP